MQSSNEVSKITDIATQKELPELRLCLKCANTMRHLRVSRSQTSSS